MIVGRPAAGSPRYTEQLLGAGLGDVQKILELLDAIERKLREFLLYKSNYILGLDSFPEVLEMAGANDEAENLRALGSELWGEDFRIIHEIESDR